jgi:hypothetical protein
MSTRDDYTVDEWEMIRRAPAEAIVAIEQASASGFFGRRREHKAAERGFSEAIAESSGLELIETVANARRAIQAKGTRQELEAYVAAVLNTAEAVALASGEPGANGHITDGEALMLRRLAGALGRDDYEPPKDDWVGLAPPNR